MKLYLFKPSENWSYCGGGMAIIAPSFEECQKFAGEQKLFYNEAEITDKLNEFDIWVLVESFAVQGETTRLVFCDYNWG